MNISWLKAKFKEYKEMRPEGEKEQIKAIDYFIQWIETQSVTITETHTTQ